MQLGECFRKIVNDLNTYVESRETSSIEAYAILAKVLNKTQAHLLAFPEEEITDEQIARIEKLVAKRLSGLPLAYIIGTKEFWSLPLKVTKDTLIPRPDTETIVEQALLVAQEFNIPQSKLRILDMGTGSGAIALALKSELKDAHVDALDESKEALEVAKENAKNLNLHVNFIHSDWFKALKAQHQYHIIVSNPPYIAQEDPHLKQGDVRFEPQRALVAPMNGLYDILNIIKEADKYLTNNGYLLIEHGYMQANDVRKLFMTANFKDIATKKDLGYNDRVTFGRYIHL